MAAPVAAERPADDVIRIGQDEFHDALEAAMETASAAASVASAAEHQAGLGELCFESDLVNMFMWMYA